MAQLLLTDVEVYEDSKIIFSDFGESNSISICIDENDKNMLELYINKENIIVLRDYLNSILKE